MARAKISCSQGPTQTSCRSLLCAPDDHDHGIDYDNAGQEDQKDIDGVKYRLRDLHYEIKVVFLVVKPTDLFGAESCEQGFYFREHVELLSVWSY